jgi:hypothetical protein
MKRGATEEIRNDLEMMLVVTHGSLCEREQLLLTRDPVVTIGSIVGAGSL